MKYAIPVGMALSLTLIAALVFTRENPAPPVSDKTDLTVTKQADVPVAKSAKLPTAESAVKEACVSATESGKKVLANIIARSEEASDASEKAKSLKKEFSFSTAPHVVEAISNIEILRNALRARMLGTATTFTEETSKIKKSFESGTIPIGVFVEALVNLKLAYKDKLTQAMMDGIKESGFSTKKYLSDVRLFKGNADTGIDLALVVEAHGGTEAVEVKYSIQKQIGENPGLLLQGQIEDVLSSDGFLLTVDNGKTLGIKIDTGTYDRASITPADSNETKEQKMAARFVEVMSQPVSLTDTIKVAKDHLKWTQDFCAKPFAPK